MKTQRIYLDDTDARVYIDAYLPDAPLGAKPAMLVIPGGGYGEVCADREGEPIALAFAVRGFCTFVLNYRVGRAEDVYPLQLLDASRAMIYIRANAEALLVDPRRVYAVGFSAGGHLAGSLATMHDLPEITEELGVFAQQNRPDAVILAYPVVSAQLPTHIGSFEHLLGGAFDTLRPQALQYVSLETQVNERTCPMFIWHTAEDEVVPPFGSVRLCEELLQRKIPVMLHIYPHGPHGFALANEMTSMGRADFVDSLCERWVDDAAEWLRRLQDREAAADQMQE